MLNAFEKAIVEGDRVKILWFIRNDPDVVNRRNEKDIAPLVLAAARSTPDIVELLIQNGAEVNAYYSKYKSTALMTAVTRRRKDNAEILLQHGAEVNRPDGDGTTPLQMARALAYGELETLLRAADINPTGTIMPGIYQGHNGRVLGFKTVQADDDLLIKCCFVFDF